MANDVNQSQTPLQPAQSTFLGADDTIRPGWTTKYMNGIVTSRMAHKKHLCEWKNVALIFVSIFKKIFVFLTVFSIWFGFCVEFMIFLMVLLIYFWIELMNDWRMYNSRHLERKMEKNDIFDSLYARFMTWKIFSFCW